MSQPPHRAPCPTIAMVAAIGLIATGALEFVAAIAFATSAVYSDFHAGPLGGHPGALPIVGIVPSTIAVLAGIQLLRGRTRHFVLAGAICAMVPATVCCVAGLPFGILTLVVLRRPEVRAHFGDRLPYGAPTGGPERY